MNRIRLEIESLIPSQHLEHWCREARKYFGLDVATMQEIAFYKISAPEDVALFITEKGHQVFSDPITQNWHTSARRWDPRPNFFVEIGFLPGVTDNTAKSAEDALALLGLKANVYSGKLYALHGNLEKERVRAFAGKVLDNELIQKLGFILLKNSNPATVFEHIELPIVKMDHATVVESIALDLSDAALERLSDERCLALRVDELHHIRDYFLRDDVAKIRQTKGLSRPPTDVELEILAQTWSEHCKHKIFAAKIDYTERAQGKCIGSKVVDGLYKSYVKKATKDVQQKRNLDWLISVFSDNAGVVRFDKNLDLCIKAETHNSPSALDPYGGALTGILGVNRDILGVGMGARPIANTDVFCFASPDWPLKGDEDKMPDGLMGPARLLEGVHKGVEDGGNKSGIPTVNGAMVFDQDYAGKPLVFCGTVGVLPQRLADGRQAAKKYAKPGDRVVIIGGSVGADGIHGATFSSLELNESSPATAVQIGDPLTQKRVTDFLMEARDQALFSSITDNGAGGISSSIGEMAIATNGALVDLKKCPLKYPGLSAWEIMISESQERMSLAVPPKDLDDFLALAKKRGVQAVDIGEFNDSGYLSVHYGEQLVGELDLHFLHESLPQMQLKASWDGKRPRQSWIDRDQRREFDDDYNQALCELLERDNIRSKEHWLRQYDHEVQAATHIKPFMGEKGAPCDSGVIWLGPHGGEADNAVAIGCGIAPRISLEDPYYMAQFAVDEAIRNVVANGGDIDNCCLLDNFCWPDPVRTSKNPDGDYKLAQLVRTCEGLYDICTSYGTPLVSGKDSMKNDFRGKNKLGEALVISIQPTLLVTAMARARIGATVTSDFKNIGDLIYLLGPQDSALAGSEFAEVFFDNENKLPVIDLQANLKRYRLLRDGLALKLVSSCHDISDGGLLVAVTESCFGGGLGAELTGRWDFKTLFSEAPGRFVVSVSIDKKNAFESHFQNEVCLIGAVHDTGKLTVKNADQILVNTKVDQLAKHWQKEWR